MIIKVLGVGCGSCKKFEQNVEEAAKALGLDTKIEKIEDFQEISSYGIMSLPAIIIEDKVVSAGKVLSVNEIKELLEGKKSVISKVAKAAKDGFGCACDNK